MSSSSVSAETGVIIAYSPETGVAAKCPETEVVAQSPETGVIIAYSPETGVVAKSPEK